MPDDDPNPFSWIQPGPAIAATVLILALVALVLIGRGPGGASGVPPGAGDGPAVQLLPQGHPDAGVAQYGRP